MLGHTGFIGRRLLERLGDAGAPVDAYSLETFDLTVDATADRLAAHLLPEMTLVMLSGIKKQRGDTLETFRMNVAMALTVCRAIQVRPVRRLVFFSSAEVYGESTHDTAMTELTPVRPTSYYGAAKFASEGLFRKTAAAVGASLVILRPPLVYGPGEPQAVYGPSGFARAAVRGETIVLWGSGEERREFLYIDDLADAACRLCRSTVSGVINISSGRTATFADALAIVKRHSPHPVTVTSRPRTRASVDQGYDNARLRVVLPDLRFTPLEEGIAQVLSAETRAAGAA